MKGLVLTVGLLLCVSCYNQGSQSPDAWDLTKEQMDSISFSTTHHYSQNYNFLVKTDSLRLVDMPGPESYDTVSVFRHDHLVVADIQTIPTDTIDSVWVKVARDQMTQGWIHETEMLSGVEPDDAISQFIDFFSNTHLLIFLAFCVVVVAAYGLRKLLRRNARIVHFNDIDSFYPTLLCLLVAASATLYASIQLFAAESWRHFYYHPSLNPFALPLHLGIFIASVWGILIIALAAVDDVVRQLPPFEAVLYLFGLGGICAVAYVIFSVSTLYYIGYPLLVLYILFALYRYLHYARCRYVCGACGAKMRTKGHCGQCGALNG
ncbi:MAG: zinc ribbon domain-containing protein [Prevotella sp.]|nr:zinc ribbon domain-containing protein [Prevotella sp.]